MTFKQFLEEFVDQKQFLIPWVKVIILFYVTATVYQTARYMIWGEVPKKNLFGLSFGKLHKADKNVSLYDTVKTFFKRVMDNFEVGYLLVIPILFLYFMFFGIIWHAGTAIIFFVAIGYGVFKFF